MLPSPASDSRKIQKFVMKRKFVSRGGSSELRIEAWNCGGLSNVTMTMCKDLGFDILALSETHKWRSDTDAIFSEQPEDGEMLHLSLKTCKGTEDGADWDTPTHARAPPGAPSPVNCVRPTHETLFADVPNLSIENATNMSKDRKLWSSNRPSLRCQPL